MIDVGQQVGHWRNGAQEDWDLALHLIERGNVRQGFFFIHLAFEKALKAIVILRTGNSRHAFTT